MKQYWTAEQTSQRDAKADRWSLVYDPTPGGKDNGDGTRSFSLRYPALLICNTFENPEEVAKEVAEMLNEAEAARASLRQF